MSIWTLTIPVEPTGQMRPRAFVRGRHAAMHKAPKQESRESAIMSHIATNMPKETLQGPLSLRVDAFMAVPQAKAQKWKRGAIAGEIRPTTKPDLDNLVKQIKDCLTQMGVWGDDKQVVELCASKRYSDCPRWEIEVRAWPEVAA